jgi:hypothetical protein
MRRAMQVKYFLPKTIELRANHPDIVKSQRLIHARITQRESPPVFPCGIQELCPFLPKEMAVVPYGFVLVQVYVRLFLRAIARTAMATGVVVIDQAPPLLPGGGQGRSKIRRQCGGRNRRQNTPQSSLSRKYMMLLIGKQAGVRCA